MSVVGLCEDDVGLFKVFLKLLCLRCCLVIFPLDFVLYFRVELLTLTDGDGLGVSFLFLDSFAWEGDLAVERVIVVDGVSSMLAKDPESNDCMVFSKVDVDVKI